LTEELVPREALLRALRRVLPGCEVERLAPASPGRRTVVYRVDTEGPTYYVRVAENVGDDLATDAVVLDRARQLGASVPEVVVVEPGPPDLDRSFLVTAELPGAALAVLGTHDEAVAAVRLAGRDTALINSLPVEGFGWVVRDGSGLLRAELSSYEEFVVSYLPERWPGWLTSIFSPAELARLEEVVRAELRSGARQSCLAHGDLDVTHIFTVGGVYSGIIDFGELRGADACFDLGHFLLHDQDTRPDSLFEPFLAGYLEVGGLADKSRDHIRRSAILSGFRQLSLWLGPLRGGKPTDPLARFRRAQIVNLLEHKPPTSPRQDS
jgi:aminoglycoside phosphotransferase